uniref:Uncharacterized protein n=1 Tax=Anguilla anguilla TaxID=7936 RepID=A0A0E9PNQ4_ANGAN
MLFWSSLVYGNAVYIRLSGDNLRQEFRRVSVGNRIFCSPNLPVSTFLHAVGTPISDQSLIQSQQAQVQSVTCSPSK